ncbi:MAG: hypothetical protein PHF61_01545 [Bacteroidales bacterium]|nr:hypothetical protein [Bacteroidales bacterium]
MTELANNVEQLRLPSPLTKLDGAYVSLIDAEKNRQYVMIMPVVPGTEVGGALQCRDVTINVKPANSLSVYQVYKKKVSQVF